MDRAEGRSVGLVGARCRGNGRFDCPGGRHGSGRNTVHGER